MEQLKLTAIIQSCPDLPCLGILCAWTTTQMLRGFCWPPLRQTGEDNWVVRPRITWLSTIQQDLKQHHLTLPEAANLAQNRPLWRMMSTYGATQSWVACQKRRRRRNRSHFALQMFWGILFLAVYLHQYEMDKISLKGESRPKWSKMIPSPSLQV